MAGDLDDVAVHTEVVDSGARNGAVGRVDGQGAGVEVFPIAGLVGWAVSTMRRCTVPSRSIRVTTTLTWPIVLPRRGSRAKIGAPPGARLVAGSPDP